MGYADRNIVRMAELILASRRLSEEEASLTVTLAGSLEKLHRYHIAKGFKFGINKNGLEARFCFSLL